MSPSTLIEMQTVAPRPYQRDEQVPRSAWTTLYRIGGIAALGVVALVPIQAVVYILWPPPTTVVDFFSTFQSNLFLGLLDLDLLLILDELLIVAVLLALYAALRRTDQSLMLIGTTVGLIGVVLLIVSREATFSMLTLSQQYADAGSDAQRLALVAAGQMLLTVYNGTSFSLGYFLTGVAMILISTVMLRGSLFSRVTGIAGVAAGVTGLIPANMGVAGFVLSFISLVPMVVWLTLLGRRLLRLGTGGEQEGA
jgi:hypothetical protein